MILGPLKYELKHKAPEIAVIHDFASKNEVDIVKENARKHLRSTPFMYLGQHQDFHKERTSKVMYQNENIFKYVHKGLRHVGVLNNFD